MKRDTWNAPIRSYQAVIDGQQVTVNVYAPGVADGAQNVESWRSFDFGLPRIPVKGGYMIAWSKKEQ